MATTDIETDPATADLTRQLTELQKTFDTIGRQIRDLYSETRLNVDERAGGGNTTTAQPQPSTSAPFKVTAIIAYAATDALLSLSGNPNDGMSLPITGGQITTFAPVGLLYSAASRPILYTFGTPANPPAETTLVLILNGIAVPPEPMGPALHD